MVLMPSNVFSSQFHHVLSHHIWYVRNPVAQTHTNHLDPAGLESSTFTNRDESVKQVHELGCDLHDSTIRNKLTKRHKTVTYSPL